MNVTGDQRILATSHPLFLDKMGQWMAQQVQAHSLV
jgi:hypothetical protein